MTKMSKIVRTISGIAFPFTMIYGLYVIAHGHLTPGGGFQGGADPGDPGAHLEYGQRFRFAHVFLGDDGASSRNVIVGSANSA